MRKFTEIDQILHVFGVALVQAHRLKKGLKVFGTKGRNAVQKEMQQHHDMETYYPVDPTKLSEKERRGAIEALMTLVRKRHGRIKARGCA